MSDLKNIPTGVKIIAVMNYIGAVLGILFGLLYFIGGGILSSLPLLGVFGPWLFIILGIIMLGLGVLNFFIGKGLWKAKKWARIVAVIFAGLGILIGIIQIISGVVIVAIITIAVNGVIAGYLLLNKQVKATFA